MLSAPSGSPNFLQRKLDLTENGGVVGRSNLTKNSLGGSDRPNLDINLTVSEAALLADLHDWFNDPWTDEQPTYDVKQQVLKALNRLGKDYTPEFIYFRTLHELFKDRINAQLDSNRQPGDHHLTESTRWRS